MKQQYYVYIMTNKHHTVLYTGVTNDLVRRVHEHKTGLGSTFTSRYNVTKLVYYEVCEGPQSAISREKQIKAGPRRKKLDLIESMNTDWQDLSEDF
jgi:putative endonuclease